MQGKNQILIIDDDPDMLSSLKLTLESAGYRVVTASSGAAGVQMFNETAPGLIICDIMMEKIDTGIRVVREIRQKDREVPIYLLSDIGRLTAANIDLNEMGCSGSFQKPFDADDLLRVIRQKMSK